MGKSLASGDKEDSEMFDIKELKSSNTNKHYMQVYAQMEQYLEKERQARAEIRKERERFERSVKKLYVEVKA